ncbi:MAG: serine hydrolase domain-containing protein, partial [Pseudomonadota bacterium]
MKSLLPKEARPNILRLPKHHLVKTEGDITWQTITLIGVIIGLLLLVPNPVVAGEGLSKKAKRQIDTVVQDMRTELDAPAVSIAIGIGDQLIWQTADGLADIENDTRATPETKFRTASIDKWMTATATMRLLEEGKLKLDEDVQSYCPIYPQKQWRLTVRQLLNHSGGVRHYWSSLEEPTSLEEQKKRAAQIEAENRGMIVRYDNIRDAVLPFKDDPLLFEPGTRFLYTSHGYRLLGCVIEGAADETYNSLMSRLIFGPANMTKTVPDDPWAIIPNRVEGYSKTEEGALRRANMRDVSENLPAGGHLSTASDLIRFATAWHTGKLVNDPSKEMMMARPNYEHPSGIYHYGFGVAVREMDLQDSPKTITKVSHTGSQDGTAS